MTSTAANVEWQQLEDEAAFVIRMPIILAPTMGRTDISVAVADSQVVVVKVGGSTIWQCRMYAAIEDEIDWTLEDNKGTLVLELSKKQSETWPALLMVPLKADDSHLLSRAELDARIARELPCLPPVVPVEEVAVAPSVAVVVGEDQTKDGEEECSGTVEATADESKAEEVETGDNNDNNNNNNSKAEEVAVDTTADTEENATADATAPVEETAQISKDADGEEATAATTAASEEEEAVKVVDGALTTTTADPTDMLDDDDLLNDALDEVIPEKKAAASTSSAAPTVLKKDGEVQEEASSPAAAVAVVSEAKADLTTEEKEAAEEQKMVEAQIKAELRGIELETNAITEKLEEMIADLAKAEEGSEQKATLTEHVKIASRMLELVRETRNLRSQPATIDIFLKVQIADIQKARVNIGETSPYETEEYQDDMEKTLTGLQLFKTAVQYLNQDPATAVHLLRLAAIHHNHAPSVVALFSIYTNVPSSYPRGASLMLQNALRGEGADVEARTNSRVGDLFNSGTRHFPPIFSLSVYFHQRAAVAGNTHSMVSLAQLFLNGECSGDDTMSPSLKRLNIDEKKANYFLQCAVDRGSIVAYLIRAAQYAQGTDGMPKSIDMAKKYYDRAMKAEASLNTPESKRMRIGTRMTLADLEKVLNPQTSESSVKVTDKPAVGIAATASKKQTAAKADDDDDIIELRPTSQQSNNNNSRAVTTASSGARMGYSGNSGLSSTSGPVAAPAKRNAFVSGSNKRKAQWERAARWGIGIYAIYALAFPLRLIMLPFFYDKVATVMELLGLGGGGFDSLDSTMSL